AAFTFNTFMSQGTFGNLCDTNNFGDPVVLYDTFEDRWVITDFAFQLDVSNNVVNPPGSFQCIAVSKSGDPVSGGWNFYSINTTGGLGDYPKLGIWPDGLYMSVNMFNYPAGGAFQNVRLYAFNKAQMYAGAPTIQVVSFDAPSGEFTLLPSNARLQTGTPPPGTPNYFATVWNFLNVVGVWKFHVDWNSISTSTLTGPFNVITPTSWSQLLTAAQKAPSPANTLDTLYPRLMVQNQYSNIGGVESLWNSHTVGASGASSSQAAVRYYQVNVTGGTVVSPSVQAATHSPDATIHRFMVSTAVDRSGNMALGYSASSGTLFPALRYAGRLATDPVNTIPQTETSLIEGTGSQSGTCGGTCNRWGDYSAMTLDVDGCTFWYTNEYYQVTGLNDNTRIGSFAFPSCTPVTTGALQGTVTTAGPTPLAGVTVALGSRTTTTNGSGFYSFPNLPVGTYPAVTASLAGFGTQTATSIAVTQGGTTIQDFTLSASPLSACFVDTSQADFQTGIPTNCDLTVSPGDATLANLPTTDQKNLTLSNSGVGITTTTWGGQTFTAGVTGTLTRVDVNLFCSGCTGTAPNLTLSVRATSANLPTGADLASATIAGFNSGAGVYYTATFASPPALTAGTTYAFVLHPVAVPSPGTYALTRSSTDVYAGGQRVTSSNSGGTWTVPLTVGSTTDAGFVTYMNTGYAPSGNLISSIKDANPEPGRTPTWGTLSWNASVPANTNLQFQVAASNSLNGPFSFVGPDATAGTFFSNGGSLAQFSGSR
ncbi:MAG TPA: carboxypeptidase-like regulatory domain-containing protein, partial [Vicinamibacterales bacterium]